MGALFTLASGAINSMAIQNQTEAKVGQLEGLVADERSRAISSDRAAVDAIERGRWEAGIKRMKGSQLVAEQRVAAAAAGADTQVGTPADVMADTRLMSEMDAQQIKNNAAREAWGHKQEASAARTRGKRYQGQVKLAREEGLLSTIGNFVGTTGNTYAAGMSSGMGF